MKNQIIRSLLTATLAATACSIQAQPSAQYIPGVEGIKAASLPPPGWYLRDYNYFYVSDQLNNGSGNKSGPPNFHTMTYANVPRVLWITDTKLLGGNVGVDALLPLVNQGVRAGGLNDTTFGIGDFFAEGTLSWHPKQFDISAACGVWTPTGDSAGNLMNSTRVGAGYWTPMLTLGATWYVDEEKTWAISALDRYEFNTEDQDNHDTRGQAETLEWGISKTLLKTIDCGVVGYYQQKVTRDTGSDPGWTKPTDRVVSIGPEVSMAFPSAMLFVSLRYEYELLAENRAQGHTIALTLTKRF